MAEDRVVVAGAGPVGLVVALGLARKGIQVTLIEKEHEVGTKPRAMAYLYPVLDGFEELGVLDDIETAGFRVNSINFVDWEHQELIPNSMDSLEGVLKRPYNISLGQDAITQVLLRHLAQHPEVDFRRGCAFTSLEQDAEGVTVTVTNDDGSTEELRAGWLVGCDGANSAVRQAGLGLAFDGMTWPDRFVAVDLIHDFHKDGYGDANFIVHPVYGGICARIDDRRWRYTFRESDQVPEEGLRERLDEFFAQVP